MTQGGFGGNFMTQTHDYRMARVRVSLEGLSVGDAFGEQYFGEPSLIESLIHSRTLRPAPWKATDDTLMSLSIVDVLAEHGHIDRDRLAQLFGYRYKLDPHRGYGGTAHEILQQLALGVPWHVAARGAFDGAGSMGNGGAMRAAPIGAYFADDLARAAEEARKSAEVTHAQRVRQEPWPFPLRRPGSHREDPPRRSYSLRCLRTPLQERRTTGLPRQAASRVRPMCDRSFRSSVTAVV